MPRMPQWMSLNLLPYSRLRIQVVSGVPKYWCRAGIAPRSIDPFQREPMAYSVPVRMASTNGASRRKS